MQLWDCSQLDMELDVHPGTVKSLSNNTLLPAVYTQLLSWVNFLLVWFKTIQIQWFPTDCINKGVLECYVHIFLTPFALSCTCLPLADMGVRNMHGASFSGAGKGCFRSRGNNWEAWAAQDWDKQQRGKVRNYTESREEIWSSYLMKQENLCCSTYVISFPDHAVVIGLGMRLGICFKVAQYPGFLRLTNLEIHADRLFAFLIC